MVQKSVKDVLSMPIGTTIVISVQSVKSDLYTRLDHNFWFLSNDPSVKITTTTVARFAQMGLVSILARRRDCSYDGV